MSPFYKSRSLEETQADLDVMAANNLRHTPMQAYTLADRLEEKVAAHGDKVFLVYGEETQTYAQLNAAANRVARAAYESGLRCGDVASVMMENRLEFFHICFGLAKIGVTIALVNTQIRGRALSHAIEAARSKAFFIGAECRDLFLEIDYRPANVDYWLLADNETPANDAMDIPDFTAQLPQQSTTDVDRVWREGARGDSFLFYIFTSGTTGLPKAARITQMKWLGVGDGLVHIMHIAHEDVFYCVLPLYHGAAGMSLTSTALSAGATIVVRRKFSTRQFWPEVRKHGVTVCQYIGEICRYLLNVPEQPDDAKNPLRKIMGAGMGTDIWEKFQRRFGVEQVYEGWSATEANTNLINLENRIGSCGRQPFPEKHNARLVKWDFENDCHVRDANGFLVLCEPGETGEMIAMILNLPQTGAARFDGYTDAAATEKKILRNVFQPGDMWWSSGDLLRCDEDRYFYFVDRIGDTYRWKSENVSTMEVAEALGDFPGMAVINVYGVKVPGHEGRAGMAAIVMKEGEAFDGKAFYDFVSECVPRYAAPVFVRINSEADMTATFKLRKVDLQKQGYSPAHVTDPLFIRDEKNKTYAPYSTAVLQANDLAPFED
ncbi:MAG TPA: long-chain-acyl-CoA synthetase [Pseudomonadales bacterium]|nr:long-chain-acyl-CoA synthetase [Pseudomonadales bacterium]